MNKKKTLLLLALAILIGLYYAFDLGQYFSLEYFKQQQAAMNAYYQAHPWTTALIYFALYVAITGLSLPAATLMTLAGGAIFGLATGLLLVSFASTLGATLTFLASRFLMRDMVRNRLGDRLAPIDRGMEKDGIFYLLTLRLVPVFPFFIVNLAMALTSIRPWSFYWISQLGMLAGTFVYVNAGTQLAKLESAGDILSAPMLLSFTLLGLFPLFAKWLVGRLRDHRALRDYPKPQVFDRDMVVIGAGAAGLVSAYIAAAVKAKVSLIEKNRMGGDCLYTGCVPSKALIRSAHFLAQQARSAEFGIRSAKAEFDFAEVMERVQRVITAVEPHDSVARYTELGVECLQGQATITSPYTVEVNGEELKTRSIIIAAGARPFIPPIPGIEDMDYLTSDSLWALRVLPKRLLILGGGPIGCELTQCFARFGSQVTQVEMAPRLLLREDPEISEKVMVAFRNEGVDLRLGHRAVSFRQQDGEKELLCEVAGKEIVIPFDTLLVAVGRVANTTGYGLETLKVPLRKNGTIETNEYLQTLYPTIFACGDVSGPYQFTHTASHQAWYTAVNALFGGWRKFRVDYSVIPWATFTDPEVARVGLNEQDARQQNIPYEVSCYGIDDLDRAIADGEAHGLIKVLTVPGKDRILGVTIIGEHAGDLIAEFVMAMRHRLGMNKILATIHIYPTRSEANKYVAGVWKKAHTPHKLLAWVARYHAWRRGSA